MNEGELLLRLNDVKRRIKAAARRAERNSKDVKLIAVSKNHSVDKISFLQKQGIDIFGENRVQELLKKKDLLTDITWYFIGHLQCNKVKYLMKMKDCKMIQTLDSWHLAKEINQRAQSNNRVMPVLIEVNIADDKNKFGLKANETLEFIEEIQGFKYLNIKGLMTIAPYVDNSEEVRPYFHRLAKLREKIMIKGFQLPELSMGMTNDFEVAIEEGSTMVRIGTGLFGQREY